MVLILTYTTTHHTQTITVQEEVSQVGIMYLHGVKVYHMFLEVEEEVQVVGVVNKVTNGYGNWSVTLARPGGNGGQGAITTGTVNNPNSYRIIGGYGGSGGSGKKFIYIRW